MDKKSSIKKGNARIGRRVLLIDDSERDFSLIKQTLEESGRQVVMDYENVQRLISNYDGYRTVPMEYSDMFKECLLKQIGTFLEEQDLIWIIDVCWLANNPSSFIERYGIDFLREFKPRNPILISVSPNEVYSSLIEGVRFVCKRSNTGELMNGQFTRWLNEAVTYYDSHSVEEHLLFSF